MKFIIDTHIFLWALADSKKISKTRRKELETLSNTVFVSSISIAELMIKSSIGKLKLTFNPIEVIEKTGFEKLDFRCEDALLLGKLPFHHKDPFDRMLVAQSISNTCPIMTDDKKFIPYDCKLI
jgi:PIN domain nuclease of toxin-antitoxin system